jgi:hypothetical protein
MNKKKQVEARAYVDERGLIRMPRELTEGVARLFTGKEVVITVSDTAKKRSVDQNAYYFAAIVNPICERFNELGERLEPDQVHEILKYKFLRVCNIDEDTGEIKAEYVRSTASLKTYEFSFYLEDCIRYAAELGIDINTPARASKEYLFPMHERPSESREKYLSRIGEYLQDIFRKEDVIRYFKQSDEWINDQEIKKLFRDRYDKLESK